MRGKLWFLGGLAAGFVLGARAGREKYEEIVSTARKVKEHPTVQEARGVVQEQANRLMSEGKDKLSQSRFAETKVGERLLGGSSSETTSSTTSLGSTADPSYATTGSTTTRSNSTGTGSTGSETSY
jgi:hypothetical protein